MSFTPDAAPYNACDNITAGSNTVSLQDYAHDEIVNKVSELDDQTTAQAESIAKNVQDIATNTADITELKSNNYLVEIKDTVTENANYETHDVKETSSDGTENQVSNFVLAAKQITDISVDADAASMTINTVNQTGAAESETLTLPAGGGTTYDDTQVKTDIATNASNISALTSRITAAETAINNAAYKDITSEIAITNTTGSLTINSAKTNGILILFDFSITLTSSTAGSNAYQGTITYGNTDFRINEAINYNGAVFFLLVKAANGSGITVRSSGTSPSETVRCMAIGLII